MCRIRVNRYLVAVCVMFLSGGLALMRAQAPALSFEAASIRRSDPKVPGGSYLRTVPPGDLTVHAMRLIGLIMNGYGVEEYQVTGYPAWVAQEEYDIVAKVGRTEAAASNDSREQSEARLRSLLAERCGLVIRHSTKRMTTYGLIVDRKGSKIEAVSEPLTESVYGVNRIHANTMTMDQLARILTSSLEGPVTDRTGLSGAYKFDLKWSLPGTDARTTAINGQQDVPLLPDALHAQVGLSLDRKTDDVDMIIVDQIRRPSAN